MKRKYIFFVIALATLAIFASRWSVRYKQENRNQKIHQEIDEAVQKKIKEVLSPTANKKLHKASSSENSSSQSDPLKESTDSEPNKINLIVGSGERAVKLKRKVLLSAKDKDELEKLLSDVHLIDNSISFISNIDLSQSSSLERNQSQRMKVVDYLSKAIEWNENPNLTVIKQKVADFILIDIFDEIKDPMARKSFAADKIELFANLKYIDHKLGLNIEAHKHSPRVEKLFKFANNFYGLNQKAE